MKHYPADDRPAVIVDGKHRGRLIAEEPRWRGRECLVRWLDERALNHEQWIADERVRRVDTPTDRQS